MFLWLLVCRLHRHTNTALNKLKSTHMRNAITSCIRNFWGFTVSNCLHFAAFLYFHNSMQFYVGHTPHGFYSGAYGFGKTRRALQFALNILALEIRHELLWTASSTWMVHGFDELSELCIISPLVHFHTRSFQCRIGKQSFVEMLSLTRNQSFWMKNYILRFSQRLRLRLNPNQMNVRLNAIIISVWAKMPLSFTKSIIWWRHTPEIIQSQFIAIFYSIFDH